MRRFASFWLYPLLAAGLLSFAVRLDDQVSLSTFGLLFALGLLAWTLLEYLLHRFFFHTRFRSRWLEEARRMLHLSHHSEPRNLDHLLVKSRYSIPISAFLMAGLWLSTGNLFAAAAVMCGIWAGFLYYESVHYRIHFSSRQGALLDLQRRRHFRHHFVEPNRCFGVTSPLWDILLRTDR